MCIMLQWEGIEMLVACRNVYEDEIENSGDGDDGNKEDDYNGEDDVILMMMIVCA